MGGAIDHLLKINLRYKKISELWLNFLEHITGLNIPDFPKPNVSGDKHKAIYMFTDVKIFCSFTYGSSKGILAYGYLYSDCDGKEKEKMIKCYYFSGVGNVSINKIDNGTWSIVDGEDIAEFHFTALCECQDNALKEKDEKYSLG